MSLFSPIIDGLRKAIPDRSPFRLFYHKIMAVIAAVWYRFPASNMEIIAITGSTGKTTVAHMVSAIFMEAGKKVGMTTTVDFRIGDTVFSNKNKQTTLGPFPLQKMLKEMLDEKVEVAIVETTSHALLQSRLFGVNVDTAVITNVSGDHLEYHGSFEAYVKAKSLLFEGISKFQRKPNVKKIAVLNRDDKSYDYMNRYSYDQVISYGLKGKAMVTSDKIQFQDKGVKFVLKVPNDELEMFLPMPGKFNLENALAAISVGVSHNISLAIMKKALQKMKAVPGRLELIDEGQLFNIVVDYAHTSDSLKKVFEIFKPVTKGKLIAVFGATGGGRDKGKRPVMGKIADTYCDIVILTNDDPYLDDQLQIIEEVAKDIKRNEGENFWKIVDRRQAIRLALMLAKEQDTVIIAGKGGEEVIVIGKDKLPWDDRQVVREILAKEVRVTIADE